MSRQVSGLLDLLNDMEETCSTLLPLIAAERQALVDLNFGLVQAVASEKIKLTELLGRKRDLARSMIQELGAGRSGEQVERITQLMPLLQAAEREELGQCYLRFHTKAQQVEMANAINQALAQEGLAAMEETINSFLSLGGEERPTYARPGQVPPPRDCPARRIQREV